MISKEKRNEKEIYKIFMKGVMPLKCPYCSTINYITAKDVTRRHTTIAAGIYDLSHITTSIVVNVTGKSLDPQISINTKLILRNFHS